MTEIERLQKTFRDHHGCDSVHLMSVPIHETLQGQTVWEGTVEVFLLLNHPQTKEGYAWSYKADNGEMRYVTVLGIPPVTTAIDAVRGYMASEAQRRK